MHSIYCRSQKHEMHLDHHVKCPMFCVPLQKKKKLKSFSTDFRESPISNFTKIRPVEGGTALIHADSWTNTLKLTGAFRGLR